MDRLNLCVSGEKAVRYSVPASQNTDLPRGESAFVQSTL